VALLRYLSMAVRVMSESDATGISTGAERTQATNDGEANAAPVIRVVETGARPKGEQRLEERVGVDAQVCQLSTIQDCFGYKNKGREGAIWTHPCRP
jgi:hypothetical protein